MDSDSFAKKVAVVNCGSAARKLLEPPHPAAIRAVALRADRLRLSQPRNALDVATAAVAALGQVSASESLQFRAWAVAGSTLRAAARLEDAAVALMTAARLASSGRARAEVARRVATLRAAQNRPVEARALLPISLDRARRAGGEYYGEELVHAGSALILISDYPQAAAFTEEAFTYLPPNGSLIQQYAVFNLCRCRLELASGPAELTQAVDLARRAQSLAEDDYTSHKILWLRSLLHRRLNDSDAALDALQAARPGIDLLGEPIDRALLLVDLAELHLERGENTNACRVALESFPLLGQLKTRPEAFTAVRILQRAAAERTLDVSVFETVRAGL